MPAAYRFLDRWVIPAPVDRVYDVIGDPLGYERWWTDFVLRSSGDAGPPRPGKRNDLLVKAYLPYKVNFGLDVIEAERPRRIYSRLSEGLRRLRALDIGGIRRQDRGDSRLATRSAPPTVRSAFRARPRS